MLKLVLGSLLFGFIFAQNGSCPMGAERCYNNNTNGENPCNQVEKCEIYNNHETDCKSAYESKNNQNHPCTYDGNGCKPSNELCTIKTSGTQDQS